MDAFTSFPPTTSTSDDLAGDYAPTPPTTVAYIERGRFSRHRGQAYSVRLNAPDGEIIAEDNHAAVYAACRELATRGIAGKLIVYRAGKPSTDIIVRDIGKAARLTIREDEKTSPCVVKYRGFSADRARG